MKIIIISAIITVIGYLLLLREKRSFFNSLIFTLGAFLTTITGLYQLLNFLYYNTKQVGYIISILMIIAIILIFIVVVSLLLWNTRTMIKREGKHYLAYLSAILGINIFIIIPISIYLDSLPMTDMPKWLYSSIITFCVLDLFMTFMFLLYLLYSIFYQFIPFKKEVHYIIVLGSGIRSEDVPPLLKSRLDKGIEYYHKNPNAYFVVSGGQGPDEPVSEAFAMAKYLYSQGISKERVLLEVQSTTTFENMKFSKRIIEKHIGPDHSLKNQNIIFTTNNYHVFRAAIYSTKAKLNVHGIGAPTAYYFLPTALIREFIAIIVMNKYFFIIMILFNLSATIKSLL